jgi:hypothetical protein
MVAPAAGVTVRTIATRREQHASQKRKRLEPRGDVGQVAVRLVALYAAAGAGEIRLTGGGVSGLQILERDAATTSRLGLGFLVLLVNEGDERLEIGGAERERRHARTDTTVADDGHQLVSSDVVFDERRTGQVRPGFTAGGIAAVTKTAPRGEQRLARGFLVRRCLGVRT